MWIMWGHTYFVIQFLIADLIALMMNAPVPHWSRHPPFHKISLGRSDETAFDINATGSMPSNINDDPHDDEEPRQDNDDYFYGMYVKAGSGRIPRPYSNPLTHSPRA